MNVKNRLTRLVILCLLCMLATAHLYPQGRVDYTVSFPNRVHHEAEITAQFSGLAQSPLEVLMSRSSPGRYALHEFAKNVYSVKAFDSKGDSLPITKPGNSEWDIPRHGESVTIKYTLYGDHADGTYAGIDGTHAHLNTPATFMWARGLENAPITVTFRRPEGSNWKIATELPPGKDENTFTAPNLEYLMDSPTELSDFTLKEWSLNSGGVLHNFRLAIHHDGTEEEVNRYVELAKAIVIEERAVFGELPKYDYGTYTFIADYLPYVYGDGMEHRNSTILCSTRSLKANPVGLLGALTHEFFHSWNVRRIRPKSLEPFNLEQANMSGELWFAEGLTNYYGRLIMTRAQINSIDRFAKSLSGEVSYVINAPGRGYRSAVQMSEMAPYVDAATSVDEQNTANTFISYYTFGDIVGLELDLTMRVRFPGTSLDDLMRKMWELHHDIDQPYTNDDVKSALAWVTHNSAFAEEFFRRYIYGRDVVDFKSLLAAGGFLVRKAKPDKASLWGANFSFNDGKAVISSPPLVGSPLYRAGLDRKDRVISFDGTPVTAQKDIDSVLAKHKPGQTVSVEYEQRGSTKRANVKLEEDPQLEIVPYEFASMPVTEGTASFRDQWLGSHAGEDLPKLTKTCSVCKRTYPFKLEFCQFDGDTLRVMPTK